MTWLAACMSSSSLMHACIKRQCKNYTAQHLLYIHRGNVLLCYTYGFVYMTAFHWVASRAWLHLALSSGTCFIYMPAWLLSRYREPIHSRSTSVYDLVDCMSSSSLMHALVMQKLYVQHMYSTELAIVHRTANSLLDMASPVLRNFHGASPTKDKINVTQ